MVASRPVITILPFDAATMCFAIAILGFMMSGIAVSARAAPTTQGPALIAWGKAMLAGAIAFSLLVLRGYAPWLLTFAVANALLVLVPAFGILALAKLFGRAVSTELIVAITSLGITSAFAVPVLELRIDIGISLICATAAVLLAWTVWLLAREWRQRRLPAAAFGASIAGLTVVGLGTRSVMSLIDFASLGSVGPGARAPMQFMFPILLYVVGSSMAFFSLVHTFQREELLEKSRRDGLTGVYTRSAFFELAGAHTADPARQPYAIIMVDVDHFKAINDHCEHRGGDLVLSHVARRVVAAVRNTDIVGRYGGEEFCILLPSCDALDASRLAQLVIEDARKQVVRLDDGRTARYTLSLGYAISRPAAPDQRPESLVEMLARADRALYRAKRSGRDQAAMADRQSLRDDDRHDRQAATDLRT